MKAASEDTNTSCIVSNMRKSAGAQRQIIAFERTKLDDRLGLDGMAQLNQQPPLPNVSWEGTNVIGMPEALQTLTSGIRDLQGQVKSLKIAVVSLQEQLHKIMEILKSDKFKLVKPREETTQVQKDVKKRKIVDYSDSDRLET